MEKVDAPLLARGSSADLALSEPLSRRPSPSLDGLRPRKGEAWAHSDRLKLIPSRAELAKLSGRQRLVTAAVLLCGSFLLSRGFLSLFGPSFEPFPYELFSPWNTPSREGLRRPRSTFEGPPGAGLHLPGDGENLADIKMSAARLVRTPAYAPVTCPISLPHIARYRPLLQQKQTILVVASYSNSDNVLLTVLNELPALVSFVGPSRIHIAITEAGSTDHSPQLLHHLARALFSLGASFSIRSYGSSQDTAWDRPDERMRILAEARNWPLDHVEGEVADDLGGFDAVVLMNDVTFCAVDMLELVYQRVVQRADMVCGLDYSRWNWVKGEPYV